MPLRSSSTFSTLPTTLSMFQLSRLPLIPAVLCCALAEIPCFLHYAEIYTTPLYQFKLPPGNTCWDYCKFLDECNTYSVQIDDLSHCKLYGQDFDVLDHSLNMSSYTIVGWKRCLLGQFDQVTLPNGQQTKDMPGMEFVIQKLENGFCVNVDLDKMNKSEADTEEYPLLWTSTCDEALSWELSTMIAHDHDNKMGCEMAVIRLKGTSWCLTSVFKNPPQAVVKRCKNNIPAESSYGVLETGAENQLLLLCPGKEDKAWSLMLYRDYNPKFTPITLSDDDDDPTQSLQNITLLVTGLNTQSVCRQVQAKNGSVKMADGVPVLLPGDKFTVKCDEGFGVEGEHVVDGDYVTSCSMDKELDLCSPIQPAQQEQICAGSQGRQFTIVELVCFLLFSLN